MKDPFLQWSKENKYDLSFKFVLFGITPFLGFIYSIVRLNTRSSYVVFFLTGIFFGMAFSVGYGESIDASRHREYFERDFFIGWSEYLSRVAGFFSFDGSVKDLFRDFISFSVSRFTSNYHWYFLTIAAIFGFFSLKSLRYLTSCRGYKLSIYCLLVTFVFLNLSIFNINGVRFGTAAWVATFVIFRVFVSGYNRYLPFILLAPLIHISFFVVVAIVFVAFFYLRFLGFRGGDKPLYVIYILSSIFSIFSVSILQGLEDLLPPVFGRLIASYTAQDYVQEINDINATMTGFYFKVAKYFFVNFLILILVVNRGFVLNDFRASRIFYFLIILMCFVNAFSFVPSLGDRFFLFGFPFLAFLWAYVFGFSKYNILIFLIPLVFFRDIYIDINRFGEVLSISDLYSSPIFLVYKYLVNFS